MSVVTVAEVRALVQTALEDTDLQDVIDREEAWLARRVGPLTGPRTVTITEPEPADSIFLPRPTSAVTVTDNGSAVTVTLVGSVTTTDDEDAVVPLMGGQHVIRAARNLWIGPVTVTFTPDDELEVRRVVIELVRLALSESPYQSETIMDYSYTRAESGSRISRPGLVRSLLPSSRGVHSIRMTSAYR